MEAKLQRDLQPEVHRGYRAAGQFAATEHRSAEHPSREPPSVEHQSVEYRSAAFQQAVSLQPEAFRERRSARPYAAEYPSALHWPVASWLRQRPAVCSAQVWSLGSA